MIRDDNRGRVSIRLSRRQLLHAGGAATVFAAAGFAPAAEPDGISRTAESIHQEISFGSEPRRLYEALMDAKRFDRVVQLSGVMQSPALAKMQKPTAISPQVGGTFSAFGGYITGRHIELIPTELIVQAWRVGNWDRGVYSIAKFALQPQGTGTQLLFDHTGFPTGQAEHLAAGWHEHYWQPLQKYLSEG